MEKISGTYGKKLYSLLKSTLNREDMSEYVENVLGKIKEYDRRTQSNLELVLKTYLECSGSVQNAASKIYVHRNTINYKIKKIEKLTKTDLSDLHIRTDFDAAFIMQEILQGEE